MAGGGRRPGGARDARGMSAPVGSASPPHPPPQPLEGQQRVKSAPHHGEHGPLQPPRPPAARLGACPEPPVRHHRSPAGVQEASAASSPAASPPPRLPIPPQASFSLSAPAGSAPRWRGLRGAWRPHRIPRRKRGGGGPLRRLRPGPEGHLCLGQALRPPAPALRKVFFFSRGPSPTPCPASDWGGFGSFGEKSRRFPSAAPPPGDRVCREGSGGSPCAGTKAVRPGAPAQPGAREDCPHQCVSACLAEAASIQPALFLPAAPERASE